MLGWVVIVISSLCLGSGVTTLFWCRVYRRQIAVLHRHIDREYAYSDKMLQHARNMAAIAERALAQGDWYRGYLRNKIVFDDPLKPQRVEKGQA